MRPRSFHFVLLAIVGFFVARIPVLPHRFFDPDEFEHAHDAWLMWKGMVPYKDFFEHHTPWYYYVLRPFFNWFHVDSSFESALHFMVAGRALSFVLTALSAGLVYRIGRLWRDPMTGVVAALFFVAQPVCLQKTVEIRPDVLALPFFLAGLLLLLRGLERGADPGRPRFRRFLAAGLAVGAAVMCTQKILFVLPGLLLGLGIWSLSAGTTRGAGARIVAVAVFLVGVSIPAVLTWAAFVLQHAGSEFITDNVVLNARWRHFETYALNRVVWGSRPVLILALLGAALPVYRAVRRRERRDGDLLLLCTGVGLIAGIWVVPVAQRQYYLMPLPIVCLFAAEAVFWLVARAPERFRPWLFGVAMIALALKPASWLRDAHHEENPGQRARLRTVYERTGPADTVMDGWQGTGVFRPHAFYYFFLHEETRAMLSPARLDAFLDDLESGRVRPKLIAMDEDLRALGPRFVSFVETHYATTDNFFYFPRTE